MRRRWSSWPARNSALARVATGLPRGPTCWASARPSARVTSASTATTSSAWASCLQFDDGEGWAELGLEGDEYFQIEGLEDGLEPNAELTVTAEDDEGDVTEFTVTAQVDTPMAVEYVENGGVLHLVLRKLLTEELN